MMLVRKVLWVLAFGLGINNVLAQTGKISGRVVDGNTGEPLPGANVVIVGTLQGATTDVDGYYTILNVRPGVYSVRASFVGYTSQVVDNVEVRIGLTTEVNFELVPAAVGLEEIVVQAERRVVQPDLSASRVDLGAEQIAGLPVTDITSVVGLQAGVQGLNIRGSDARQAALMLDGFDVGMRRSGQPLSAISYASVEEIQIQSGGFTAEYGDLRSGIVNVVTKEGPRDRYTGDIIIRYAPPQKKYFGISPSDPNSYWMRPYLDPETWLVGTRVGWADDPELQQQYPSFDGFQAISELSRSDNDPNNDMTPEEAQKLFLWRHRRDLRIKEPDYVIDAGLGGPVPLISSWLGDLRFYASFRREQNQYIIPLSRDGYDEQTVRLKLTSDIASGMKLTLEGLKTIMKGSAEDYPRTGITRLIKDGDRFYTFGTDGLANYNRNGWLGDQIFSDGVFSIGDIDINQIGLSFTHTLNATSFYEIKLQRIKEDYFTRPPRQRDTSCVFHVTPTYCVDEAPLGFSFEPINSWEGMRMGAHWAEFRDTSSIVTYRLRIDYTNQINRFHMIKVGAELEVADQDINYGYVDFLLNPDDVYAKWKAREIYGGAYIQDKIEFRGMIANVGLRLDYYNPNTRWWDRSDPYTDAFMGMNANRMDELVRKVPVSAKFYLSPRVGISFPITSTSKLYFNYGHARQRPDPDYVYALKRDFITNRVWFLANPDAPLEWTIQYELGYEQSLFDQYLLRIAGFYKDIRNQPRTVRYKDIFGLVDYTTNTADNYGDIRGFEISLMKHAGDWFRGFVNYTYMVASSGNFGLGFYAENRVEQRSYERTTTDYYQSKPVPQPFARINLEFLTPQNYGPEMVGLYPLGGWRISLLGEWQLGPHFTYTGRQQVPGIQNNMRWKSYRMVDLRISKSFHYDLAQVMLFADIENVFNIKNFNAGAFSDDQDYQEYLNSLYLPKEMVEGWEQNYQPRDENGNPIYGNDIPGDLDKDYIDKPNLTSFWYLFPRRVNFGLRVSF